MRIRSAADEEQHSRAVRVLTWTAITLWALAVALAVGVAVLLAVDSSAPEDSVVFLAASAFVTIAIPATAATIGLVVARRPRRR